YQTGWGLIGITETISLRESERAVDKGAHIGRVGRDELGGRGSRGGGGEAGAQSQLLEQGVYNDHQAGRQKDCATNDEGDSSDLPCRDRAHILPPGYMLSA